MKPLEREVRLFLNRHRYSKSDTAVMVGVDELKQLAEVLSQEVTQIG